MPPAERPRWRVNEPSFVGHNLCPENAEVHYTPPEGGEVAANLSPMNDAAQEIIEAQKSDHPDKRKNHGARHAAEEAAEAERAAAEAEAGDGLVPASAKPARGKASKVRPAAPADEDVG